MCGINGIYTSTTITKLTKRIEHMNDSISHRGPDASGTHLSKNLALGHRRLSIIDLTEYANQPMISRSGDWVIVFNGEIYNFKELKEELSSDFTTGSDTEVILAAVEEKGVDWFIKNSNGMFSIGLFNQKTMHLYLIRDRLGIKPLYYYKDDKKIIFSSEIKGILSSGLVKAEFNDDAIDEYLGNRYVREPYTFFHNIYQIEAGTYLSIDENINTTSFKYWDLPNEFNLKEDFIEDQIAQNFENELIKAIDYRLISDVPLGTYLSGGVDSSLITAITSKIKKNPINTYTIGFPELNEFEYSKVVSERYKTTHHEILLKKEDYVNNWEKLIGFKDSPLGVPNEIPLALMSTELKEKITVVLSGEGADELMGGYGRIFRSPFEFSNKDHDISFYKYLINDYEYVSRNLRDKYITTSKRYRKYFDQKIEKEFKGKTNEENVFRFFHKYHVKGLLQRVDITTMQTSVEARVPFLDHNLIEYAYRDIPYKLKLKWNSIECMNKAKSLKTSDYSEKYDTPKYLLRKIAYNYLPKHIVDREKVGFPVPLTEWFDNLTVIATDLLPNSNWLKKDMINELVAQSKKEHRAGQILWMFINIEIFRKKYFQKEWRW